MGWVYGGNLGQDGLGEAKYVAKLQEAMQNQPDRNSGERFSSLFSVTILQFENLKYSD
jgi:hypothetical protein